MDFIVIKLKNTIGDAKTNNTKITSLLVHMKLLYQLQLHEDGKSGEKTNIGY